MTKATFSIAVRRPFRIDLTALVLRRRNQNTISHWDGHSFQRVLAIGDTPVRITATQGGSENSPRLLTTLESYHELTLDQQIEAQLLTQKMFGVTTDIQSFCNQVSQDPVVWKLVGDYLGVKPTRFPTVFEALISSVTCQNIKFEVGIELLNNLSEQYGLPYNDGVETMYTFPRPEDLADATDASLRELGYGMRKAHEIVSLTKGVLTGSINLDQLELESNDDAFRCLMKLPGVSRWAAEYTMVRGLGRLDVFPGDDKRAADTLQRILELKDVPSYDEVKLLSAAWHPYEGLVYFHLLLDKFRRSGYVQ
jgi:DNA-3-methyladenine glycosylase II